MPLSFMKPQTILLIGENGGRSNLIVYTLMGFSVPLWKRQRRGTGYGWKKRGNDMFHRTTGRKQIATKHMLYVVSSLAG
jgi:hypothetical protein